MTREKRNLAILEANRTTRRWLVGSYWAAVLILLTGAMLWNTLGDNGFDRYSFFLFMILGFPIRMLGETVVDRPTRRMYWPTRATPPADWTSGKPLTPIYEKLKGDPSSADEREEWVRSNAYLKAYRALRGVVWISVILLTVMDTRFLKELAFLREIVVWFLFLAVFCLPASIRLWTEPDLDECDEYQSWSVG